MFFKRTLAAGAIVIATAVGANAADIPMAPMAPVAPPPPPPAATFDWTGAYVGGWTSATFSIGTFFSAGAIGGYDFQANRFVAGLNFRAYWTFLGGPINLGADINARAGVLLGDRTLIYGVAGLGLWLPVLAYWNIGGGVEFAVTESVHVFGEVKAAFSIGGGYVGTAAVLGLTFR